MKFSSGALELSLLSPHWVSLHVLPGTLRPGPLCCPELSSQIWRWAARERASQVPEEDPTRPGVEKPGKRVAQARADLPPATGRILHPLLPGEGPGGGGRENTHPKPHSQRPRATLLLSQLPRASAPLAQRLRKPRGFPRPWGDDCCSRQGLRGSAPLPLHARHPGGQAPTGAGRLPLPQGPALPGAGSRAPSLPSRRAARGDSPALGLKRRPPRARGRRRRGRRAARGSWHSGRRAPGAAEPRTRPEI